MKSVLCFLEMDVCIHSFATSDPSATPEGLSVDVLEERSNRQDNREAQSTAVEQWADPSREASRRANKTLWAGGPV